MLNKQIEQYLKERHSLDKVSWFYYNTVTKEEILYREDVMYLAASTIKVPVVMAWTELVNNNVISKNHRLQYLERHFEESDEVALYDDYQYGDYVSLSYLMKLAIVYSDNPSNHIMRDYYPIYGDETFRQWFSRFSKKEVDEEFYKKNLTNASIMLEVLKELYENRNRYTNLIEDMKIAAEGRYIQASNFDFDVAQKYGEYDKYEHAIAIVYSKQPILIGIYTELWNNGAKEIINDLSRIMVDYAERQNI